MSKGVPKVSILVPIFNVEKYLPECLNSLVQQTEKNLEIICINDGSTDDSLKIIQDFAARDRRIKIINKQNSGYGDSMNQGIKKATGEYIGIVESDDFIEPETFEILYNLAHKNQAELARANYFHYRTDRNNKPIQNERQKVIDPFSLNRVVDPEQEPHMFYQAPAIWSAIYKRDFLLENRINFLPTPGASYQDTGFNFKVWASAHRAIFTDRAFLHYRLDNESSSVNNPGKVFCVVEEYDEAENFIKNHPPKYHEILKEVRLGAYRWNIDRLAPKLAIQFIQKTKQDFGHPNLPAPIFYLAYKVKHAPHYLKENLSQLNKKLRPSYRRQIRILSLLDDLEQKRSYYVDQK